MLLNTDMELAFDTDVDNTGNGSRCRVGGRQGHPPCPEVSNRNLVGTYADVSQCFELL